MKGTFTAENSLAPRCLTIKDAALYLGATVWAIRSLIWDGDLPCLRIGKRQVIDVRDLDALIAARKTRVL
jgi:excisionase family DNA binding protein